jgi:hypothetical protein
MSDDATFRTLQKGLAVFLCFYFVAGLSTFFFLGESDKNVPPLFHWFLFSWTPNEAGQVQYSVRVTSVDGTKLEKPLFYAELDGVIDLRTGRARDLMNRLARALEAGDSQRASEIREAFEKAYLKRAVEYEVVRITYKPLERFRTGALERVDVLAEFETNT